MLNQNIWNPSLTFENLDQLGAETAEDSIDGKFNGADIPEIVNNLENFEEIFLKYLINRGLVKDEGRKIWVFLGDGEMDEPESLGAIGLAAREKLDNLIFVINCNLQRLDGPVRGNGKIIQELEGSFRGTGWNVIKVIWGSYWDQLLAKDKTGLLVKRRMKPLMVSIKHLRRRAVHMLSLIHISEPTRPY